MRNTTAILEFDDNFRDLDLVDIELEKKRGITQVETLLWKEELKLEIYRRCFDAMLEHKLGCCESIKKELNQRGVNLSAQMGFYVRKNKGQPYVAYLELKGNIFSIEEMALPKWHGWRQINQYANELGELQDRNNEKKCVSEKRKESDKLDCSLLNSVFGLPSPTLLKDLHIKLTDKFNMEHPDSIVLY